MFSYFIYILKALISIVHYTICFFRLQDGFEFCSLFCKFFFLSRRKRQFVVYIRVPNVDFVLFVKIA